MKAESLLMLGKVEEASDVYSNVIDMEPECGEAREGLKKSEEIQKEMITRVRMATGQESVGGPSDVGEE